VKEREGGKGGLPWKRRRPKKRRERGASEKIRQREQGRTEKKKDWNSQRTYAQFRKTAGTCL
jgi:hypothetical protein